MAGAKEEAIPQKVKIFSIASFLNDFGAEMVFSVWPIFVTTVIGADLIVLGLLDGIGNAVVSISGALSGYLSDRFRNRKAFIVGGYFLSGISKLGYSFAGSWPVLVPLRVLDRFGKIRDAPRDAEVADSTGDSERGRSFGFLDAFDHAGAVSGIIASFFLLGFLGFDRLIMIAAVPPIIAALIVLFFIKEGRRKAAPEGFRIVPHNGNFRRFLVSSVLLSLGSFSYSFLIIAARDRGFGVTEVPLLYLAMTVCAMAGAATFGRLSDRFGRKRMIYLSSLLLAGSALLLIVDGMASAMAAFLAFGMHLGSIKPLQKTLLAQLSPPGAKASSYGILQLASGLAAFPASFVVGLLWETSGHAVAFCFSLIMVALSAAALMGVKEAGPQGARPGGSP